MLSILKEHLASTTRVLGCVHRAEKLEFGTGEAPAEHVHAQLAT